MSDTSRLKKILNYETGWVGVTVVFLLLWVIFLRPEFRYHNERMKELKAEQEYWEHRVYGRGE